MRVPVVAGLCLWSVLALAQDDLPEQWLTFSNEAVRVFAVELRPGASITVGAKHSLFLITLQDGVLAFARPGEVPIINTPVQQGDGRLLYGSPRLTVVNKGSTYHGLLVEFLDPAVSSWGYQWATGDWDWGATAFPPAVAERATFVTALPLGTVLAWKVQLVPGDALPTVAKGPPFLLIPVSDLELRGEKALILGAGEVRWFGAGSRSKLVNAASAVAKFVVLNFGRNVDMPAVIPTIK